jgi:catechol 2,3-dioxygenase-like lactoylglutathione lyase family enzyme
MSTNLENRGLHHLGLATHDMEATLAFYEDILGFPARVCDLMSPQAGGTIRHAFLDTGNGELIAFMECNDVPGVSDDFDAGINRGLGIKGGMIHFAFKVQDTDELEARREYLADRGVEVTDVVDHGWCQSIYFHDPNRLQLEYCCLTSDFTAELLEDRAAPGWTSLSRT